MSLVMPGLDKFSTSGFVGSPLKSSSHPPLDVALWRC